VEDSLIAAAPRLSEKVDETRLIAFLEQAGERAQQTKITVWLGVLPFRVSHSMLFPVVAA